MSVCLCPDQIRRLATFAHSEKLVRDYSRPPVYLSGADVYPRMSAAKIAKHLWATNVMHYATRYAHLSPAIPDFKFRTRKMHYQGLFQDWQSLDYNLPDDCPPIVVEIMAAILHRLQYYGVGLELEEPYGDTSEELAGINSVADRI